jgi:hypothetical protein
MSVSTYDVNGPSGVFSSFDGLEEGLDAVVWVFAAKPACSGTVKGLKLNEKGGFEIGWVKCQP